MIKRYEWILFALVSVTAHAQQPKPWGAFNQYVDATPYRGKKIKVEAAVKIQAKETMAEAEIWLRVDLPDNKIGFFYNMMDKPIRDTVWKTYSITGNVASNAKEIFFGGLYQHGGKYFFDDFKLSVQEPNGSWTPVNIDEPGFESDTATVRRSWHYLMANPAFTTHVTSETAFSGKQCFEAESTNVAGGQEYGSNSETGKFAEVNHIRLYYETYGSGAPLLLLHGNSSSISSFSNQIPELAKHFRVIAVDTRGQGRSTEDGRTYTYDLFAEDMNAFLDYLGLDSVNILGWSDGGNTGLIMAMKYPSKVRRLVTMGAVIFIDHSVVGKDVFKILNKEKKELTGDTYPGSANRLRLVNLLLTEPRHHFSELGSIHCPVLVMAGEKDVVKPGHTKGIAAAIPGSTLLIAEGETHYFPSENPRKFNDIVLSFLEKK